MPRKCPGEAEARDEPSQITEFNCSSKVASIGLHTDLVLTAKIPRFDGSPKLIALKRSCRRTLTPGPSAEDRMVVKISHYRVT